ncbi:MAG: hypothetical protein AAF690_09980 [Acidobacteriota bacterium]
MDRAKILLRWSLGAVLLLLGAVGLVEYATTGYDPLNEGIQQYEERFKTLFNALMLSYIGPAIRLFHVGIGLLLLTRRWWWIALLLHLPFAFNILAIHLLYDLPPANGLFFAVGLFVSLATFGLVAAEPQRLRSLAVMAPMRAHRK